MKSPQRGNLEGLVVRPSEPSDAGPLEEWLSDPEVAKGFPTSEPNEVHETARRWIGFYQERGALTAVYHGTPVGIAILFLQHYERIRHQAMHILLVAKEYRRMGIGSILLERTIALAKEHGIELFHVEVYGDPEVELFYKRRGFQEFARQQRWTKEGSIYRERVCLERFI